MAREVLPVVAVIPAHNAAKTLPVLLDELIRQEYDRVVVIDDASTDNTVKIARSYGAKVLLIKWRSNVGSGANRNRIIGHVENSILHFIDADMKLLSKNTPVIIRSMRWFKNTGYIGGMVRNPDGSQNPFNYGPRPSYVALIQSVLQYVVWQVGRWHRLPAWVLRAITHPILHAWPNIYRSPKRCRTFWTAESNMIIRSSTFEKVGGYDPMFQYSEIVDFALRLHRLGMKAFFDPSVDTQHNTIDNILHRRKQRYIARKQFIKKHGRLHLVAPRIYDFLLAKMTRRTR